MFGGGVRYLHITDVQTAEHCSLIVQHFQAHTLKKKIVLGGMQCSQECAPVRSSLGAFTARAWTWELGNRETRKPNWLNADEYSYETSA